MSSRLREEPEPAETPLNLKDIIFKLSRNLDIGEVQRFKFLLVDHLPKTKLTKSVSFRQVLQTLEEMTIIRQEEPWFLIEILLKIGRDDLVDEYFPGISQATMGRQMPTFKLSDYRLKLFDVANNLHEHNILELIDRFKDIPKSVQEKTQTSFELIRLLEEKTVITKKNTERLQIALREIGRSGLADKLFGGNQEIRAIQETTSSIPLHQGTPFNYPQGNSISSSDSYRMKTGDTYRLLETALSVGRVGSIGTGFRVGSKYIMSAAHVIKLAFDLPNQNMDLDGMQELLRRRGLSIDFRFASPITSNHKPVVFRVRDIVFFSEELDTAIAELSENAEVPFPTPLKLVYDNLGSAKEETFHLLGHDGALEDQYINLECKTISDPRKLSAIFHALAERVDVSVLQCFNNFGRSQDRVQFQGIFKWGGSGSPGVVIRDNEVRLFTMLLKGYFEIDGIPENLKILEGVRMWSIKETLKEKNIILHDDIFGDCYP